jgi:hypothetical protein
MNSSRKLRNKNQWGALENGQVDQFLHNIKGFKGTKAKDLFKGKIKPLECAVVNLDDSTGAGTHFTAYYNIPNNEFVYYFDSYGVICPSNIEKYLRTSGKKILFSNGHLQKIDSSICGFYCIYFINEMNKGTSYYDIISPFGNDCEHNDNFIKQYTIKNFPELVKNYLKQ